MKKTADKNNKIKEMEKKIEELSNNWKRALADYQNLERRVREEKEQFTKYAKSSLVAKLLPCLDSFEQAAGHLKDNGLNLSIKTLKDILTEEGIQEINPVGQRFDPKIMEAVDVVDGEDEKVISVYQKGYVLYDRVLRPAKVKVGRKTVSNVSQKGG